MLETFPQNIAVVLYKKRLQETAYIGKMRAFKNRQKWHPSKGYRPRKTSLWVKN